MNFLLLDFSLQETLNYFGVFHQFLWGKEVNITITSVVKKFRRPENTLKIFVNFFWYEIECNLRFSKVRKQRNCQYWRKSFWEISKNSRIKNWRKSELLKIFDKKFQNNFRFIFWRSFRAFWVLLGSAFRWILAHFFFLFIFLMNHWFWGFWLIHTQKWLTNEKKWRLQ